MPYEPFEILIIMRFETTRRGTIAALTGLLASTLLSISCSAARPSPMAAGAPGVAGQEAPGRAEEGHEDADTASSPLARRLLEAHNQRRESRGLPALGLSPKLNEAARVHARQMVLMGVARHVGPDGSEPADRVRRQDYPYRSVAENVAGGQETVEQVMEGWMNSPGHRKNILGDYAEMGAAREADLEGRPYWCVVFASPIPQLDPSRAASELLRLINRERRERELGGLTSSEALAEVAAEHAAAMAGADELSASGPEGLSPLERVRRRGGLAGRLALSVASGRSRPPEVLDTLLDDPSQRRNLLGPFDRAGIAYATSEDGTPYWSLILAQSRGGE